MTAKKSICLDLLVNGNVESFVNFYKTFQDEQDYETLKELLIKLERSTQDTQVMEVSTRLGQYYSNLGNHEYASTYYQQALVASKKLPDYSLEIEATLNLGREYYKVGILDLALDNFMKARDLSIHKEDSVRERAILTDILDVNYSTAQKYEEDKSYERAIDCYIKLLELIKKFDAEMKGPDAMKLYLKLGSSYEKIGSIDIAMKYLETYLSNNQDEEEEGTGSATLLLAECYQKSGRQSHAIKLLEAFVSKSENIDDINRAHAYNKLGKLYSGQGRFDKAVENFQSFYNLIDNDKSDKQALQSAIVNLGIATANLNMESFFKSVSNPERLQNLLDWKATRSLKALHL